MADETTLETLVPERLKPLTVLEAKLLRSAPLGEEACGFETGAEIDLAQMGEAQEVRASYLEWLVSVPACQALIHRKGVSLRGAKVTGGLDLSDARVDYPLRLEKCVFEEKMVLERGEFHYLDFSGSQVKGILADEINVKNDWVMGNCFQAQGEVRMVGASIGGQLACDGGRFENTEGAALTCDGMIVQGGVFLRGGFKATGEVRLLEVDIGCQLDCNDGEFEYASGYALNCNRMTTNGSVFLRGGFKATGEVCLLGASIGGQLDCSGGQFENEKGRALSCDRMTTNGSVFLSGGFKATGEVRLLGANIGGNLECKGGMFENPGKYALNCDRMNTTDSVILSGGFKATGEVRLLGANIGSNLDCSGGKFENAKGNTLSSDSMTVKGSVFFRQGFQAQGALRLLGASIGADLYCSEGIIRGDFIGENMKVAGSFWWNQLIEKPQGKLDLMSAEVGNLIDDESSWPEKGKLFIDGLVYRPFLPGVPAKAESRLRWLNLQPDLQDIKPSEQQNIQLSKQRDSQSFERLHVQPYEQLIRVFGQMGLKEDAKVIAIEKQRMIRRKLKGLSRAWSWIEDLTIGYGYHPEWVFRFIVPVILLGMLVFGLAFASDVMLPTDANAQWAGAVAQGQVRSTDFAWDALAYSLDVFLPIVDFHQETAWMPDVKQAGGYAVQYYMYLHILLGWVLTTLGVAGMTGLVRND